MRLVQRQTLNIDWIQTRFNEKPLKMYLSPIKTAQR